MISAWNLLWIVPVSAFFGVMLAALCAAGKDLDKRSNNKEG